MFGIAYADAVREAMGKSGAGEIGNYTYCSFPQGGIGRFKPEEGAHPSIGEVEKFEISCGRKIETVCRTKESGRNNKTIKKAHPYERK